MALFGTFTVPPAGNNVFTTTRYMGANVALHYLSAGAIYQVGFDYRLIQLIKPTTTGSVITLPVNSSNISVSSNPIFSSPNHERHWGNCKQHANDEMALKYDKIDVHIQMLHKTLTARV